MQFRNISIYILNTSLKCDLNMQNALQYAFNKNLKDAFMMFSNILKACFIHIQIALQNVV